MDESCSPDTHFHSLDPSFTPQPPVGANLEKALEHLLSQMLESQYPAHPRFGTEIKLSVLRKVLAEVERAAQVPDGRIAVDKPLRPVMLQIAVPLKLGDMGETHFALGRDWYSHFGRQVEGQITVAKLRAAIDEPSPMGLPAHAQNLVILVYADQANRSFFLHGGPYQPKLEDLPDELELREQALPSQEDWDEAITRAGKIFGISVSPLRNASNLSDLATKLKDAAGGGGALPDRQRQVGRALSGLADRYSVLCAAPDSGRGTGVGSRTCGGRRRKAAGRASGPCPCGDVARRHGHELPQDGCRAQRLSKGRSGSCSRPSLVSRTSVRPPPKASSRSSRRR